ncbi:hypothetical protein BDV59DRAFT_197721 [Aspergillus ambiguus]|uniref:uncharacterized protein n=1 Tax=Aspergillus ambiguus TaxID=176160 RepID=UPI003CCD75B0
MRYEDWDVLLFPEDSKVPIQEFKTQCFVTEDRESPYLYSPAFTATLSYYPPQGNVGRLPILTTFIPSIPLHSPFRVSVHTWEKPGPSRLMQNLLQPEDALLFEVRVLIDGECVAGSVFSQRTSWPHVIELSSNIDRRGNQDNLRFPQFHQDLLEQRHWDAGDQYGRIRVVISEGFARLHRSPPFERVRDLIAFSFQHAPLSVLETSGIAWPNPAMWTRNSFLSKHAPAHNPTDSEDTHAHSPAQRDTREPFIGGSPLAKSTSLSTWGPGRYQGHCQAPQYLPWQGPPSLPYSAAPESCMPDPFIDRSALDLSVHRRVAQPSCEDITMRDYSAVSSTSRSNSTTAGGSYVHSKHPSFEGVWPGLPEAARLPRPLSYSTHAQATTVGSLPAGTKPSAAAEARSASYAKSSGRNASLKEVPPSRTRETSGSSAQPSVPDTSGHDGTVSNRRRVSPSVNIRSRKERRSHDHKENGSAPETPHRESQKTTPSRSDRLTSQNSVALSDTDGNASVRKNNSITVKVPALLSPAQDLAEIQDLVEQAGLEELLGSKTLANSIVEVAEID